MLKAKLIFAMCFLFSPFALRAEGWCKVMLPTKMPKRPVFILKGCKIGGSLSVTGPHVFGHFVVDLSKLTSGLPDFDHRMKTEYLDIKKKRYAALTIYPFDMGDKTFKAWIRINGVSKEITVDVLSVSYKHLDAYFTIDLKEFNFKPGYGWDLIDIDQIDIHARIYPHGSKKRGT
jgi:hypothetical protein